MKKHLRRYFLSTLAVLLVLSNFSFATSYMICSMQDKDETCSCEHHKSHTPAKELAFTQDRAGCCGEGVIQLDNTNQLTTLKSDKSVNPASISVIFPVFDDIVLQNGSVGSVIIYRSDHVPKYNIPVLNSSLLI